MGSIPVAGAKNPYTMCADFFVKITFRFRLNLDGN